MPKTIAPGGRPPNRLSEHGRWAQRRVAPQVKQIAAARNVDNSQVTREITTERPSEVAKVEEQIRAYARHPKTDPWILIQHLETCIEEEVAKLLRGDVSAGIAALVVEETRAEGIANLGELELLDGITSEEALRAHDALMVQGARIRELCGRLRRIAGRRSS